MKRHSFRASFNPFSEVPCNSSSDACVEFRVKYVGAIEKLHFEMCRTLQEPLDLVNYIDVAQGALHRHPLYLIVHMLCYDDGLGAGKNILALKTTDSNQEECNIWVYQCNGSEQAQAICKVLSTAFDSVLISEKS
ncbi:UNVERIFIED_CONTAM: hypothetical protein FKN15_056294 [Acipenser sinensis]